MPESETPISGTPVGETTIDETPIDESTLEQINTEEMPVEISDSGEIVMPGETSDNPSEEGYTAFSETVTAPVNEETFEAGEDINTDEAEYVTEGEDEYDLPDKIEVADKRDRRKNNIVEEILDWLKTICIGIIAGVLLVLFVIQRDDVYGGSMKPTLNSGDVVFTQKISTYFKNYDRGDIVILDGKGMYGYDRDEYLIKRVIGLPGETIRIADGNVYIKPKDSSDFFMLEESYLVPGTQTTVRSYGVRMGYDEVKLGDNEYYCMGDNRPESNDSRTLGIFTADRIKGVAVIRLYPFDGIKLL